jgi:PPE family
MKVDPSALAAAAQRIAAALDDLTGGDPVHPPLGADAASAGAAARLSAAAATLAALLDAHVAALTGTAAQLDTVAAGFTEQEALNTAAVSALSGTVGDAGVGGFAPPLPPATADVRPPMPPPVPIPGQLISSALSAGTPDGGDAFIAGWTRLAAAVEDAAALLRRSAAGLPESWDSEVATDVVRDHLVSHAQSLGGTATRAYGIVKQAGTHAQQFGQAIADTPSPQEFAAINQQLQLAIQQNAASGGKLAGAVAALSAKKAELETQAQQAYSAYHAATEATTESDPDAAGNWGPGHGGSAGQPGQHGTGGAGGAGGPMGPDKAGETASQLPQMMSTALGAAGGLVGGAVSMVGQLPQAVMQAGEQLIGQATQGLSGFGGAGKADAAKKLDTPDGEPSHDGIGAGSGGGGGRETTPASGSLPPAVTPSTGLAPTPPTTPGGGLPPPAQPGAPATAGGMPMGIPLGGLMGAGGAGGASGQRAARPKKLVVPPEPHTESVTGKVNDRIGSAATAAGNPPRADTDIDPDPPNDGAPGGHSPREKRIVVRRINLGDADE